MPAIITMQKPINRVATGSAASGYAHGDSITITGSGFGAHGLDISFMGGAGSYIESATPGATLTSSAGFDFNNANSVFSINDASRGRVAYGSAFGETGAYNACIRFDHGSNIDPDTPIFVSWFTKLRMPSDANGQWKIFRINQGGTFTDTTTDFLFNKWFGSSSVLNVNPAGGDSQTTYGVNPPVSFDEWTRLEMCVRPHATSGWFRQRRHIPGSAIESAPLTPGGPATFYNGSIRNYPDTDRYRWFVWQNYLGNGSAPNAFGSKPDPSDPYMDDMYVQVGTLKRVVLTDNATFASATVSEIQMPTAWSDTSVTVEINQGGLSAGTYWLHVIDEDITTGTVTVLGTQQVSII